MVTCAVSSLVVALDATILVPVLPTLAIKLHGTSIFAFWTGTAYLLSHAVLQPFLAALSDIIGRREVLAPGILLFGVGSVVCALAHNFTVLLTGRVIQGVGGAAIISLSQLIFADLVPLRQRPQYFTLVLGAWAIGSLLGPLVGGVFIEYATWRWCFWINLPICSLALPMSMYYTSNVFKPQGSTIAKLIEVDWIGNIIFVSSLTWFLVAISWAGVSYAWSSWQTLVPLSLGGIGTLFTVIYETRAPHPFLQRGCFNTSTTAAYICALFQGLTLYMALYYVSFYFTAAKSFSAVRTGTSLFPATALMLPVSAVVSALITRFGRMRIFIWLGLMISTIASGLFIHWDSATQTWYWALSLALFGTGMGMILSSVNFSIQASVATEDAGQAAAMYAFVRSLGMSIGVAVSGTVFQNCMRQKLVTLGVDDAAELAKDAEAYVVVLKDVLVGDAKNDLLAGYVAGFRGTWICMTTICGAGLVISTMIRSARMNEVREAEDATKA